jgi:hypothetical protein
MYGDSKNMKFLDLPNDIIHLTFQHLRMSDLYMTEKTCRTLHKQVEEYSRSLYDANQLKKTAAAKKNRS